MPHELDARAIASAIAIPAYVVQAKGHGHGGTPMALAPLAHVLYSKIMRHNPGNPRWHGRDRFVLSAGHASLLQYVQLYLTGYGLTLDDLAASRTLGSLTPGHPEYGHTPGVETSTGPLGQGVATAVGMAIAARKENAAFAPGRDLFDPMVWVIVGDGCLAEGISAEAASLAGTLGLDNLVVIWDDNRVTIDATTDEAFTEDVHARFAACGWRVLEVDDASDAAAIEAALSDARQRDGRPVFVAVRSVIGAPSKKFGGTPAAHYGGFGAEEVADVLVSLGFPADAGLEDLVPEHVLLHTRTALSRGAAWEQDWNDRLAAWQRDEPENAERWRRTRAGEDEVALLDGVEVPAPATPVATRKTNGAIIQALHDRSSLWGGSADLASSTNVAVPGEPMTKERPDAAFLRFGIREHAMAAILSGIALHGTWRPFGSTYLVFSDYMRPAIRLAALMSLPVIYVFTHDSVAVGEDGPTHQPIEQLAGLRTVPGLAVVRPADAAETVAVWRRILADRTSPVALALSRQDVPVLPERADLDRKAARGGYVAWQHGDGSQLAIIATGSGVHVALEAARRLAGEDLRVRVVSMPSVEWFAASDQSWRDEVLPPELTARVAIEAGRGDAWYRWVGLDGEVVGIDTFGESGSGPQVLELKGMTAEAIIAAGHRTLARHGRIGGTPPAAPRGTREPTSTEGP